MSWGTIATTLASAPAAIQARRARRRTRLSIASAPTSAT
jgi:hypothetical protein